MMNAASKIADTMAGKKEVKEGSTQPDRSSSETMRAVTWQGPRKMVVEKIPKPKLTHDEDVIVKITSCTICSGSDGHIYAGEIPTMDKGLTIGHEGMGIVVEKGKGVQKFNLGDRVVIAFDIACGKCDPCKREEYTACDCTNDSRLAERMYGHAPAALFGYSRLMGNIPGSQAEFVRVPFADTNCFKVPDDVPDEKALYISDILCTSLHACDLGEVKEGSTVAIWGLGPIGLCTARWCQIKGVKRVIGIDEVRERLDLAESKLRIEVLDRSGLTSKQVCDKLLEIEPRGFDVCIEAAGFRFAMSAVHKVERAVGFESDTPEIIDECLTVMRPYGNVSIIGDYAGYSNSFPVGKIMFKHATLRSGQCPCQRYFGFVMSKLQDGTFDPSFMVRKITFDQIPEAYEKLHNKEAGWIKVFVQV